MRQGNLCSCRAARKRLHRKVNPLEVVDGLDSLGLASAYPATTAHQDVVNPAPGCGFLESKVARAGVTVFHTPDKIKEEFLAREIFRPGAGS